MIPNTVTDAPTEPPTAGTSIPKNPFDPALGSAVVKPESPVEELLDITFTARKQTGRSKPKEMSARI